MSISVGLMFRVLVVAFVLIGIAIVIDLVSRGSLSVRQLQLATNDLSLKIGFSTHAVVRSRRMLATTGFLVGLVVGWWGALSWMGRRLRRRPLIIADLHGPDMLFVECVRHVRVNAFPPIDDDMTAVRLVFAEAGRGRLTLWRQTSADMLSRVPQRKIRAAAARLASVTANNTSWHGFVFLSTEVERLWPSLRAAEHRPRSQTALRQDPATPQTIGG